MGILSILVALFGGADHTALSGLSYLLLWPVLTLHGIARGRQVRRERDATSGGTTKTDV